VAAEGKARFFSLIRDDCSARCGEGVGGEKGELAYLEGHPQRHSACAASSRHFFYQLRKIVLNINAT